MATYRGAKIENEVVAEYTDNYYAKCKTCLKLDNGIMYKANLAQKGYDRIWVLEELPKAEYPKLYEMY